ncbi:MAG: FtsX-like permease family protein [Ruminococcus sp.]
MSPMLIKNIVRDISRTKARFISIMLIIMLGVGFLVGIHSTAPSMYSTAKQYYDSTNLMDFRLISSVGFSEEDVKEICEIEGVTSVMPSYFCDVLEGAENSNVVRLIAIPEKYEGEEINTPRLKEGRMPEKDNEILMGYRSYGEDLLGKKVGFVSAYEDEELSDSLVNTEYTVVGIVDSPLYISFERGYTNVGNGSIRTYMLVPMENFKSERFTEIYLTFDALKGYTPYSDEYDDALSLIKEKVEAVGTERTEVFKAENITPAQSSIDEAYITLNSERDKADIEITQAQQKIDASRQELTEKIAEAEALLSDAKAEIDKGRKELDKQTALFEKETASAQAKLEQAEQELKQGKAELSAAKTALKESLYEELSAYGITREQFDEFCGGRDTLTVEEIEEFASLAEGYKGLAQLQLSSAKALADKIEKQCAAEGTDPMDNPEYVKKLEEIDNLTSLITGVDKFLGDGKEQLILAVNEITAAEKKIADGEAKLQKGKTELEEKKALALSEISKAEEKLRSAKAQYESGVKELEATKASAEQKLKEAQTELDSKKAEAEKEFAKAEKELGDAQAELDSVPVPKWYVNSRDDNPGYSSYEENVERVNSVGKVFPVFFLLVAVLVCVTTMSRLIEEQRSDIGALTTLGYRRKDIISKYVIYSVSATVVGALVGIALGVFTIPTVIFKAYGIMYSLPDFTLKLNLVSAIAATVVAIVCTSCVAVFTCYSLLRFKPATLLRPKAPKPGKRILLERVGFIWNRMSFFAKVTARNIFRYKARFLMTVIGVAGCTALIFAGLGLQKSINDIVHKQFEEIFVYDVMLVPANGDGDIESLRSALIDDSRIDSIALSRQALITVESEKEKVTDSTYIAVAEDIASYSEIVSLRDRKSQTPVELEEGCCVISEKLANTLDTAVGETVTVTDGDYSAELKVSGICENYVNGYVFVDTKTYENSFGVSPEYGMFMCRTAEDYTLSEDEIANDYMSRDDVLGITFSTTTVDTFSDMIQSLNYVVIVMIVSAAALAFVVLYNLTNINIAERKREISTLKVLGFKNTETSAYIYRENILLAAVGIMAGLLLGIWLLNFIINTVEVSMVMFGRGLHFESFLFASLLTLFFAAVVNMVMHIRIKKIDMVESLKSVE